MNRAAFATEPALDRTFVRGLESAHEWAVLNYVESLNRRRPELNVGSMLIGGGRAFYAGPSAFSFAVNVGMDCPVTPAQLDSVEHFYAARGLPCKLDITLCTDSSVSDLTSARKYRVADLTSVLSLAIGEDSFGERDSDIGLRWAGPDDCALWVDMVARNFYVSDPGEERRKNIACMFHAPHALNVIATVAGEVAGVSSIMLPHDGGRAVIYGSCTAPEFRRLGVHREMLRLRVETARAAGCDTILATALPGSDSERNLVRCGFQCCYVKTTWAKDVAA